ncbi:hypothetical protein Q5692_35610 [Microcoleus sp. C2C3]|uniref:hypothetical protein n=1 Tax=unclassified Microcoleus TaxID=2642155 RepID=UPI002FCF5963
MHNNFTYGYSELPPVRPEIKAEIVALDVQLADLILKSQGNYRELEALAEMLDNCLDSCQLSLNVIRIADDRSQQSSISLTDLPKKEKEVILSTAITSTVAIKVLAGIFGCDFETAASHVAVIGELEFGSMTPEAIERAIEEMAKNLKDNPDGAFFIRVED